jgi:phosphatidylserine synthase
MRAESDDYKVSQLNAVMKYVGLTVAIIYLMIGIAIVSRSEVAEFIQEQFSISRQYTIALSVVLIAYGAFRAYRVFNRYFLK